MGSSATAPRRSGTASGLVLAAAFVAALGLIGGLATPARAEPGGTAFDTVRHQAWRPEERAPPNIQGVAQSPDGFLWLATATGLYRFDGLTFDRIPLEGGDGRQSLQVASVAAAPNGDVWIGYDWGGIALYRQGRLRPANPGEPSKSSVYLTVTRDGAVWARAPGGKGNRLVRFKGGRWEDIDASWNLPLGTNSSAFLVARDGALHLLNPDGVRRLRPGARRFEFQPLDLWYGATIAEDPKGRIWVADRAGLFRVEYSRGKVGPVTPLPPSDLYRRLVFGPDGAAWVAGAEDGVRRLVPEASGDRFRVAESLFGDAEGLSSPVTLSMARDSEQNIWVGTLLGLDRFSPRRAVRNAGLPPSYAFDSFRAPDGAAYLVSNHGLMRVGPEGPRRLAAIPSAETLCGDGKRLVVATALELFEVVDGRTRRIPIPPRAVDRGGQTIRACAFDEQGRLLLSMAHHPLYRLEASGWRAVAPLDASTRQGAYGMLPAPGGGLLLVYPQDKIARLVGDRVETLWSRKQGWAGFIKTGAVGRKCVWFGAQDGLACLSGGRMRFLGSVDYPQLTNVTGIVETDRGWTWLTALSGIMRVRTSDLEAAVATPGRPLQFQPFGVEDGLRGQTMMMYARDILADGFGRLWFFTNKGLVTLNLAEADAPTPPPQVAIRMLLANGREFRTEAPVRLPAGTRSFEIDYTATTLADPQGTTFRYRLEGVDEDWTEAGDRRQAFYTNLSPGAYRFRVAAVSSAGTPSARDAVLQVTIAPFFFQTRSFAVACAVLALLTGVMLYQWRLRALAARLGERMQERLDERERIARELHDTLLQGVSGLLLQFQALASRLPRGEPLRHDMEAALDRAEDLVVQGRDRVRNLRAADEPRELEDALAMALTRPAGFVGGPVDVRLVRTGRPRMVTGAAAAELAAMASEALSNAIRHGGARTFTVVMDFQPRELRVRFEDDGSGIPDEVLKAGGRPGHFGLIGLRERAERLQGRLEIGAAEARGARLAATIPARCAYPSAAWSRSGPVLGRWLGRRRRAPPHPFG